MDKNHYGPVLILSLITALGLVSSALCIVSEFKKTKSKNLKLDGNLCFLPGSPAFIFGIAALICLVIAQITGNLIICREFCFGGKRTNCKARKPKIATTLLFLSWISFGIAVLLISTATSMNRRQPYGKGWLNGECYIVKDGVYIGAAVLVLLNVGSILVLLNVGSIILSATITIRKSQAEQAQKVHAQV